jgi:hypothetical protein
MNKINCDKTTYNKFWKQVLIPEDYENYFWKWIGYIKNDGYGVFFSRQYSTSNDNRIRAHRFSYMLYHGIITPEEHVLHRCDNRICVSPYHLFLGDRADNVHDMVKKERHPRGQTNGRSKLMESDALKIRELFDSKVCNITKLCELYNIGFTAMSHIVHRRTWTHI